MEFSFLESLVYGFVSGMTEFLPVSSQAHRMLLQHFFGTEDLPLLNLFLHAGALLAVWTLCRTTLARMSRERKLLKLPARRRRRLPDDQVLLDGRIVRSASVPILLSLLLAVPAHGLAANLPLVMLFFLLNGLILYLPARLPSGNKDSRSMSRMDALLLGLTGAFAILPGISRVGGTTSVAVARGADRSQALKWSLLLSVPALLGLMAVDLYGVASSGIGNPAILDFVKYILAAGAAYGGAYLAILAMRFLAVNLGFSGFAYYSWGAALLVFILYMSI